MIRVGLLWHSISSTNLGVGALTFSQMAIIDEAAARAGVKVEYALLGWTAEETYDFPQKARIVASEDASLGRMIKGKSRFLSQMRACDIIFDIGEGDSFSDIYGAKRFSYLIGTKLAAVMQRVPIVMSPQTIGPFANPWARRIANFTLHRMNRVFARDGISRSYLETNCIENAAEAIDVAFKLPFEKVAKPLDGKIRFGLNVSGLLFNGGYTGKNEFGLTFDYAAFTRQLIVRLLQRGDCEIHLVSHVAPFSNKAASLANDDDLVACRQLYQEFPQTILVPSFESPIAAKSYISSMEFFVGARMHACIGAFSSGVPVFPLAYSRKFNGLFGSLGYTHMGDCLAESAEQLMQRIIQSLEQRDLLKQAVDKGNQLAQQKIETYVAYVAQQLGKLRHA